MIRPDEERYTFLCECGDPSDLILMRFWSDDIDEDEYPSVYVSYHLNKFRFWKRLWAGIKYIFGYTTKWGEFGEIILEPEDWEKVEKVRDYLKKVLDIRNKTIEEKKKTVAE